MLAIVTTFRCVVNIANNYKLPKLGCTGTELAAAPCGDDHGGTCSSDACSACSAGANQGAPGVVPQPAQPEPVPPKRSPSHYLWAVLRSAVFFSD